MTLADIKNKLTALKSELKKIKNARHDRATHSPRTAQPA
jgi:hypothetical protein